MRESVRHTAERLAGKNAGVCDSWYLLQWARDDGVGVGFLLRKITSQTACVRGYLQDTWHLLAGCWWNLATLHSENVIFLLEWDDTVYIILWRELLQEKFPKHALINIEIFKLISTQLKVVCSFVSSMCCLMHLMHFFSSIHNLSFMVVSLSLEIQIQKFNSHKGLSWQ